MVHINGKYNYSDASELLANGAFLFGDYSGLAQFQSIMLIANRLDKIYANSTFRVCNNRN